MTAWIEWTPDRHKYTAEHGGWVATVYDAAADPNVHGYKPGQRCSWGVRSTGTADYQATGFAATPERAMADAGAVLQALAEETPCS